MQSALKIRKKSNFKSLIKNQIRTKKRLLTEATHVSCYNQKKARKRIIAFKMMLF